MINFYFFITTINAQICNPTSEFVVSAGTPTNEKNAEIETQPLTTETKIRKCSN